MPIPLMIVGGMMAAGAISGALSKRRQGKIQAQIAMKNRELSLMKAASAIDRGAAVETNMRFDIGRFKGSQISAIASTGAAVGEGSAGSIEADTAMLAELEVLTVRNNATMEAWGHKVAAEQFRYEADVASAGGMLAAGTSLLTGGAATAGVFMSGK